MPSSAISRRRFVTGTGALAAVGIASSNNPANRFISSLLFGQGETADYTLHIKTSPIEIGPKRIVSATTYNGQVPCFV